MVLEGRERAAHDAEQTVRAVRVVPVGLHLFNCAVLALDMAVLFRDAVVSAFEFAGKFHRSRPLVSRGPDRYQRGTMRGRSA